MRYTFIALFIFALSALSTQTAVAQCPDDNTQFLSSAAPVVPGVTQTLTSCLYGGEYRLVNNMIAGQTYRFSTCGDADFDTQITIYSNSGGPSLAYNDDACGLQSEVDFTPAVTGDYRVLIDRFNCQSESTCMTLNATLINTAPPANDDACNAQALTLGVPAAINNEFATSQQWEPNPGAGTEGTSPSCDATNGWCNFELDVDNSVWYTFVAPASGCVKIDILGPTDLQMAVWTTSICSNFFKYQEVAANDDGGPGFSPFLDYFSVQPGQTYYVQVDGYNGADASGDQILVTDGAGPVPAPWTTSHVGAAVGNFSYTSCGEEYTVSSNQYSSPFKDQGGYILQTLCGDGYIQARVNDIDGLGWAGIVMRESTAQGSKKVALKTQLVNLVRRDLRKSTNGLAQSQQYPRPGGWNWLRLERVGSQFAGYISEDGVNWQQLMAVSFPMNNCLQVGMFVESINVNAVTTAVFGNPSTGPCPCLSSFGAGGGSYAGPYCGASTGTPGFPADPTCEAAVCAVDPFCCNTSWDGICAGEAVNDFPTECAACLSVGPPPPSPTLGLESAVTTPQTISDEVDRAGSLTVYPNPSDGLVNIQVENFIGKAATVVIYNSLGQEVYTKSFDAIETSTITADLTSAKIASGMYNLNFVSEGQRITKQVVINK